MRCCDALSLLFFASPTSTPRNEGAAVARGRVESSGLATEDARGLSEAAGGEAGREGSGVGGERDEHAGVAAADQASSQEAQWKVQEESPQTP